MAGPVDSRCGKCIHRLFRDPHLDQQQDRYGTASMLQVLQVQNTAVCSDIIHWTALLSLICDEELIILLLVENKLLSWDYLKLPWDVTLS